METSQIRIKTDGFRAIAKADIIINGITVVAGENGSGKSTLSKLLYFLYKTAANYNSLVAEELQFNLRNVISFLEIIEQEFHYSLKERGKNQEYRGIGKELSELRGNISVNEEQMRKWILIIKKAAELYYNHPFNLSERNLRNSRTIRLRYIVIDILKDIPNNKIEDKGENLSLPFDKIESFVESKFKEAVEKVKSRPISLFNNALASVFEKEKLPKLFEVYEYGEKIVSKDNDSLSIPYYVQNTIYIDTPMAIGEEYSDIQHWEDLNILLHKKGKLSFSGLSKIIATIIKGDVSFDDDAFAFSDFLFKRRDGSKFDLLDCATGIKSFGILQLLLKNGSLNDKTLMIIDEPESHLHPQWIIEYARLIVLLNKKIGMKFFIASHNPDMVSAIKYIAEKQKVDKNLNFYLAEKTKNEYIYKYKHLGIDIEPIFGSFNIAMERINKYGA